MLKENLSYSDRETKEKEERETKWGKGKKERPLCDFNS